VVAAAAVVGAVAAEAGRYLPIFSPILYELKQKTMAS
jgi:hypothetical protein